MSRLPGGVYLVLDTDVCAAAGHRTAEVAAAAVRAGVRTVQLRAKRAGVRDQVALAVAVADALRDAPPAVLLVDDRADVALAARSRGARVDGVHVGQHDLEVSDARALLGPDAVIGVSVGRPDLLSAAAGADYVGSGPVRLTPTKPEAGPALGPDGVRAVADATALPVVAIGGITTADTAALRAAGAHAVAVVSAVCAAADPGRAAAALVDAWARAAVPAVAR